ncbi:MAG: tRNA lysidine(34) synthetase TilS [Bythopirellula sp.]
MLGFTQAEAEFAASGRLEFPAEHANLPKLLKINYNRLPIPSPLANDGSGRSEFLSNQQIALARPDARVQPTYLETSFKPVPDNRPTDASAPSGQLPAGAWLPRGWQELNLAVALSGGADSMALLRVFHHFKEQLAGAGQLLALHVNHQLRGSESAADAQWCQQQCDLLGVPLEVVVCDTAQFAAESGESLEASARAQRYQLLKEIAEQAGVRYLATGHTRDDQVETVLFRIVRGTGLRGLVGIPPLRALTSSLTLIRPLLGTSREQIIRYLARLGQGYRTDSSNVDSRFTRNRLRHDLLPLLREQYNSEFDGALLRIAEQAGAAQEYIEAHAQSILATADVTLQPQAVSLLRKACAGQPPLIVAEALRITWRKAGLAEQAMTFEWWRRLGELVQRPDDGEILNLPGNVRASIAGDRLVLEW